MRTLVPKEQSELRAVLPHTRTCRMVGTDEPTSRQSCGLDRPKVSGPPNQGLIADWNALDLPGADFEVSPVVEPPKRTRKSRFDVPPPEKVPSPLVVSPSAPRAPVDMQPPKTALIEDLSAADKPQSSKVFVDDLKLDMNTLQATGGPSLKKDSIAKWALQIPTDVSQSEEPFAGPSNKKPMITRTNWANLNSAALAPPPTTATNWAAVAARSGHHLPVTTPLAPSDEFPALPSARTGVTRSPSPLLSEDVSARSPSSAPLSQENVLNASRTMQIRYPEIPLRYEDTDFEPRKGWERNIVTASPPLCNIVDVSESGVLDAPSDINGYPFLGPEDQTTIEQPILSKAGQDEDLISLEEDPVNDQSLNVSGTSNMDLIDFEDPEEENVQAIIVRTFQPLTPNSPQRSPIGGSNAQHEEDNCCERLQQVPEPDTRRFYRTMAQQKRSKKKRSNHNNTAGSHVNTYGLPLPEPLAISSINRSLPQPSSETCRRQATTKKDAKETRIHQDDVLQILEHARSFKGQIDMEIQLGQALIHSIKPGEPMNFAKLTMKKEPFEKDLAKHLAADELKLHFSRRLTTDLVEACHIPVASLWDQKPCLKEAFYELVLLDKENKEMHVRVTGDPSDTKILMPLEDLGSVYLHFPKRIWDARFLVTGRKDYVVPAAVHDLVRSLKVSIAVEERDGKVFRIPTVDYRIESNDITVKSFCSKRRFHHQSTKKERLTLQVTEVREYELKKSNKDPSAHRAASGFPNVMVEHHVLWFEASMHISPHPLLAQNLDIQLGDDADWKPEDVLSEDLLNDLKSITEQFVTRLDGVGLSNKGLRGDEQDLENIARMEQEKRDRARGVNQSFW